MMQPNDQQLNKELRYDEGIKYSPYFDIVGVSTVGVGHNLKAKPISEDWHYPLQDWQVDQLLADDLQVVFDGLDKHLSWWRTLSYARQRVLANMAFQLGIDGLLAFVNTLKLIKDGKYNDAATGMKASKWYKQTPNRVDRLIKLMKEG